MEKQISILPKFRIQKTFKGNHPLNKDFQAFYSIVGRKKYLSQKDKLLTIKRVPYESLDLGGISNSSRWTFATGKIIQNNGSTSIDLMIQPQGFIRKIFYTTLLILLFFVVLTVLTAKPAGAIMLIALLLFLVAPWYLLLKSGMRDFKEELEKDIERF